MSLDLAVARALHGALVLERALHEPHGWSIAIGGVNLPVTRTVENDGVVFRTVLPDLGPSVPADHVELHHHGVLQAVRPFTPPFEDGPYDVTFALRLVDPVSV